MSHLVDIVSVLSIVGIWPRYIEPRLVCVTELNWQLSFDQRHLDGFTIVHFTDLHFSQRVPPSFLDRVARRILRKKPDVILFTGDFLCYSHLEEAERLTCFLQRLQAPHGCFCSFGNHDYARYVSRNGQGFYDIQRPIHPLMAVGRALSRSMRRSPTSDLVTPEAASTPLHEGLCTLLHETPFQLLENMTVTLPIGLNITGLGDRALGRCRPKTAFMGYDKRYPGLVLSHNPDTFPSLRHYPGDWMFSGHTHGEQVYLPFIHALSRRFTRWEHPCYTRGLVHEGAKRLYVNRGVGSPERFRFRSPPEILVVRAKRHG